MTDGEFPSPGDPQEVYRRGRAAGIPTSELPRDGWPEATRRLQDNLPDFLDPNKRVDIWHQLATMQDFWVTMGHPMPPLTEAIMDDLEVKAEAHPGWRAIFVPLLNPWERHTLVNTAAGVLPKFNLQPDNTGSYLWVDSQTRSRLADIITEEVSDEAFWYRTSGTRLEVGHSAYLRTLEDENISVRDSEQVQWIPPFMSTTYGDIPSYKSVGTLWREGHRLISPEAVIITQLLHEANGVPKDLRPAAGITNEAFCFSKTQGPLIIDSVGVVARLPSQSGKDRLGYTLAPAYTTNTRGEPWHYYSPQAA